MRASSLASTSYAQIWALSAQSATDYSTWTTWSKPSSDYTIPASVKYLRWMLNGTQLGTTDVSYKAEIDSITVGLTNFPRCKMRTEASNYRLDCTIGNSTTSDSMRINIPMELNQTLYVDTDPDFPTAKYKGALVNGCVSLSSIRSAWLKLQPGSNTITYLTNASGASDISIAIKWRDRANFF
jgi:hypothetical protein